MQLGISINQMYIFPDEANLVCSNYGYVLSCRTVGSKHACDGRSGLGGRSWRSLSLAQCVLTNTPSIAVSSCLSCDKMLF